MKSVVTSVLFFLALGFSQVLAVPQNRGNSGPPGQSPRSSSSVRPSEICGTVYGPRKTLVGRTTTTSTITFKTTTTFFKTSLFTTTPLASTLSLTDTALSTVTTTLSTPTETSYTTTTKSTTLLFTDTVIQTTTSVLTDTTSLVSTSTIPALPGFTPIESSLTEIPPPVLPRKRAARPQSIPRGQIGQNKWEVNGKSTRVQYNGQPTQPGYPQSVKCTVVTSKTITISKTSTILSTITAPTPVIKVTTTTTSVSTSTLNPDPASSTITESTTTTFSSTLSTTQLQTQFTTTTSTSYTSTTTEYAACATNNFLDGYNGVGIGGYAWAAQNYQVNQITYEDILSPLDCCIRAVSDPLTWFYSYLFVENTEGGEDFRICQLVQGATCPVPTTPVIVAPETTATAAATIIYATAVPTQSGYTVGNGACGVVGSVYDGTS